MPELNIPTITDEMVFVALDAYLLAESRAKRTRFDSMKAALVAATELLGVIVHVSE